MGGGTSVKVEGVSLVCSSSVADMVDGYVSFFSFYAVDNPVVSDPYSVKFFGTPDFPMLRWMGILS